MWGGGQQQPWAQWPLQQQHFANTPHDQVDWASLAKQWIQHRDVPEQAPHPTGHGPPIGQGPPPPPPPKDGDVNGAPAPPAVNPEDHIRAMATGNWGQQQWGAQQGGWGWPPPQQPPQQPPSAESFDYGHGYQAFDYNHGGGEGKSDGVDKPGIHADYNHQTAPDLWDSEPIADNSDFHRPGPPVHHAVMHHGMAAGEDDGPVPPIMDAAKRKSLPLWIRQGLEKMEQEKEKKAEKEKLRKEQEAEKLKREQEEAEQQKLEDEKNSGEARVPRKSRFDSDGESSDKEADGDIEEGDKKSLQKRERSATPESEEEKTEE
ncbi:unnamed protein product, partial [Owenia fusiformis]